MLNQKITLYVPGTDSVQSSDPLNQEMWTKRCLTFLAKTFGGATADAPSTGAYMSPTSGLVLESIIKVYAYTDSFGIAKHKHAIMDFARNMAKSMGQEVVSVEINNSLQFVNPNRENAA